MARGRGRAIDIKYGPWALLFTILGMPVHIWNDLRDRQQEDVLMLLDNAIRRAEGSHV